jgi:hypothetical protein
MLGVAPGNNAKQIAVYKKQFRVFFPVVPDKEGEIYYALGVPTVPCMIVTNTQGKVLMSHVGVIADLDQMLKEIREIHKHQ